jgi:hypothetical protein
MMKGKGGTPAARGSPEGAAAQAVDHGRFHTPDWGGWEGKISPVRNFSFDRVNVAKIGQFAGEKILTSRWPRFTPHPIKLR